MENYPTPANWTLADIEDWARRVDLPSNARNALFENEVDGNVLLTLTKSDLRDELLITSLAARRYLWDAIERIRGEQHVSDYKVAVEVHEQEIDNLVGSPEHHQVDPGIVEALRSDVVKQYLTIEDNAVARDLQGEGNGLQAYEDAEIASGAQRLIDRQHLQEEYDHAYALSLSGRVPSIRRPQEEGAVKSLMALCIDTCVSNRINVAEALCAGTIAIPQRQRDLFEETAPGIGAEETKETDDEVATIGTIFRCHACYEENLPGFELACTHTNCKQCMTRLMRTALGDTSLLPLRCCEIPIDMNLASMCLKPEERETFLGRAIEAEANKKMYCPSCNAFVNLDPLVGSMHIADFLCGCGTELCTTCATESHAGITCDQNKARGREADQAVLALSKEKGWKQCPGCNVIVELVTGCNHITCASCNMEFCYQCRSPWDARTGDCSSGNCARWEEENLVEGGEARVQAQELAQGRAFQPDERREVLAREMRALHDNETCDHYWRREYLTGECERCGFDLWVYGMVCQGDCASTVCHTCAQYRIPQRGWR